jgi:hypothetical protein
MSRNSVTLRFPLILSLVAMAAGLLFAPAFAQSPGNSLAGFWLVEGSPDPVSGVPPFFNIATLTKDGQVVNVTPDGTFVGGWERLAGHEYAVTFTGFLPGPVRVTVFSTVTLDKDAQHFGGPFRTEVRDLGGNLLFGFEGTVSASRQAVEPY